MRKRFFHEDHGEAMTLTNVAPAKSTFGKILATFFDRLDLSNFFRPVYPLARIDANQQQVIDPKIPHEIHFVANSKAREDEVPKKIGVLILHDRLISDSCDLKLQSHHPKNLRR